MRRHLKLLWTVVLLFLAGCTALPTAQPFVSPVAAPMPVAGKRVLLPLLATEPWIGGKKGLAGSPCAVVEYADAFWYYTWSASGADCIFLAAGKYEPGRAWFVPMIRDPEKLISAASLGAGARIRIVLGPNEPDRPDQANMTIAETVSLMRWMELRYGPAGWQIIASAMSMRSLYLEQIYAEYTKQYAEPPRWQALAVHCYRPTAADCIADISYYVDLARKWGLPGGVWVTEYAFHPCWFGEDVNGADMLRALREAETLTRWLEAMPEITAYAWFIASLRADDMAGAIWTGPHCGTRLYAPETGRYTTFGEWYAGTPWPEPEFQAFLKRVAREGHVH